MESGLSMTRVWITGVGAATPLGHEFTVFADNLLAGRSGVAAEAISGDGQGPPQFVARVRDIPVPPTFHPGRFQTRDRLEQLVLSCAGRALADAGLLEARGARRIGLVLGLGAEHLRLWEQDFLAGGTRVFDPGLDTPSLVHRVHRDLALVGPATAVAAACASGAFALALARRWVHEGWAELCLAGSADLVTPMAYAGFRNLRALSRRDESPAAASRPFDRDRDGFVMGEGGAVFVLEPEPLARRRGARPYGELAGFGASSDASHMVIPSSDPEPACRAVERALEDAGIDPDEVDYVNAHAAGTPVGDRAESHALRRALGASVERVPVSSTKSMTGHLLSGAAAVEALACLVALDRQAVPPTINLDHPDPECALCHVPHEARPHRVRVAVSNSFGFGGSNTCLVLKAA